MTDIVSRSRSLDAPGTETAGPSYELIELLFFAYRDFVQEADAVLERYGFGRAHHRVLHFVSRNPGLKVAELLNILKITKQSLGRVLRDLVEQGFVEANEGAHDRRHRLLTATARGQSLAAELAGLQSERIASALGAAGLGAEDVTAKFLTAMVNADEREAVMRLVKRPAKAGQK
jgi:DNA-binding MarR family transcriptional regulator